jgi:hypothetical protein
VRRWTPPVCVLPFQGSPKIQQKKTQSSS